MNDDALGNPLPEQSNGRRRRVVEELVRLGVNPDSSAARLIVDLWDEGLARAEEMAAALRKLGVRIIP